jgi:tetratricopeptide (TPR) repeat protein
VLTYTPGRAETLASAGDQCYAEYHYSEALFDNGQTTEAIALLRPQLDLSRRLLGEDHPSTWHSLNLLGRILDDGTSLSQSREAVELFREALAWRLSALSPAHIDTLATRFNLALALSNCRQFDEAEQLFREDVAICRQTFGDHHPEMLESMRGLAGCLADHSDYAAPEEAARLGDESIKLGRQIVRTRIRTLGATDPRAIDAEVDVLHLLVIANRNQEAERVGRQLLRRARLRDPTRGGPRTRHGDVPPNGDRSWRIALRTLSQLAEALYATAKFEAALPLAAEAVALCRQRPDGRRLLDLADVGEPSLSFCLNRLGDCLFELDRLGEAEPYLREALTLEQKRWGHADRETSMAACSLCQVLITSSRLEEARSLLYARDGGGDALYKLQAEAEPPYMLLTLRFMRAWLGAAEAGSGVLAAAPMGALLEEACAALPEAGPILPWMRRCRARALALPARVLATRDVSVTDTAT